MKSLIQTVLVACVMAAPVVSFAQSVQGPLTRAEVRADLVRVENAGYHPRGQDGAYPADIQAAEAKIAAQDQMASNGTAGTPVAMQTSTQSAGTHLQASMSMVPRIDLPRSPFYAGA
ncbi:DUF4148 domain-containing protein [Cupriavidus sp. 30B13]|uniref:DUF4148 domain-containing protein n=1 Tax=Cupriavidus sp. 30B13 TaxID=3384241 RepID=UPI003B90A62C